LAELETFKAMSSYGGFWHASARHSIDMCLTFYDRCGDQTGRLLPRVILSDTSFWLADFRYYEWRRCSIIGGEF
jgi:hypothetical protein